MLRLVFEKSIVKESNFSHSCLVISICSIRNWDSEIRWHVMWTISTLYCCTRLVPQCLLRNYPKILFDTSTLSCWVWVTCYHFITQHIYAHLEELLVGLYFTHHLLWLTHFLIMYNIITVHGTADSMSNVLMFIKKVNNHPIVMNKMC